MADKLAIPGVWEVPDVFRRRLGERSGRQRAMEFEGHLLLVLHAAPAKDQDERQAVLFWRRPTGEWMTTAAGGGLPALISHLDSYESVIDFWEAADAKATTSNDYYQVLENLAPLQRAVGNLHAVLQEARKKVPDDRDLINLRDRAYDLSRRAELLNVTARNGLDYALAQRAEEQAASSHHMAKAAHRLNLLAAFFFPIATLSAVFGVNLKFGLEEVPPPWPFLVTMAAGIGLGAVLTGLISRTKTP